MTAVDWGMLSSMTAAGYTPQGIAAVAEAQAAGLPTPSPGDANNHTGTYVNTAVTATPAPVNPGVAGTTTDQSAKQIITAGLNQFGLGSLADQAWSEYLAGTDPTQVISGLRNTPQYAARFPGMAALQAKGEAITESQYISYESEMKSAAMVAGLPVGFYDQPDDFAQFIGNGVSVQEYKDRISQGFQAVNMAPPAVQQEFGRLFGANGDAALASYFLDPTKAEPLLTQQLAQAQFAGAGDNMGFHPTDQQSLAAAQSGITSAAAASGFQQLDANAGLYQRQLGDRDNVTQATGINAQFGLEAGAQQAVKDRLQQRVAQFQGAPTAPETESAGASGFGTASR